MEVEIQITAEPLPEDSAWVRAGLRDFNARQLGPGQHIELALLARNQPGGEIIAGLLGGSNWEWLHIDILWVHEDYRKHGLGRRLMAMAEAEAVRRGCKHAMVDTFDFQAPDFYRGLGYTVWGVLQDMPLLGHQRIFFRKDF